MQPTNCANRYRESCKCCGLETYKIRRDKLSTNFGPCLETLIIDYVPKKKVLGQDSVVNG